MKHKSVIRRRQSVKNRTRRLTRRRTRRLTKRRTARRRIMRGGEVVYVSPAGPTPSSGPNSVNSQVNQQNNQQNTMNHQGGARRGRRGSQARSSRRKYNKKQKGGMTESTACGGSQFANSPDGFGYASPDGCIQVPVVQYGQSLATASVNISATGQANAEFDNKVGQ